MLMPSIARQKLINDDITLLQHVQMNNAQLIDFCLTV